MSEQVAGGKTPGKGLGIAAMVVGIVAIVLAFLTFGEILGAVAAILGIAGFLIANKAKAKNMMAIVGIVLGVSAVGISLYQESRVEAAFEEAGFTEEGMNDMFKEAIEKGIEEAEAEAGH